MKIPKPILPLVAVVLMACPQKQQLIEPGVYGAPGEREPLTLEESMELSLTTECGTTGPIMAWSHKYTPSVLGGSGRITLVQGYGLNSRIPGMTSTVATADNIRVSREEFDSITDYLGKMIDKQRPVDGRMYPSFHIEGNGCTSDFGPAAVFQVNVQYTDIHLVGVKVGKGDESASVLLERIER